MLDASRISGGRGLRLGASAFLAAGFLCSVSPSSSEDTRREQAEARIPETKAAALTSGTVVFVCEHGSVKSVIAMSLLERAARDRGLEVRALSRGLAPDERVPAKIAAALAADGFEVENFQPRMLESADIAGATRVVTIGVDLQGREIPSSVARAWNDVPPASVDYEAALVSLQHHVDTLLDELESIQATKPRLDTATPRDEAESAVQR